MGRHWAINGRFLTQKRTGVQRYAWEIVRELDDHLASGHALARGLDVELVVPPTVEEPLTLKAIRMRRTGVGSGHLWEQTILPLHVRNGAISLTNTGPLAARKHIVCIHDLNTRHFAGSYSVPFRLLYRTLIPALGRAATIVTTVSHYSADQLVAFGVSARNKIMIAPNGHEHVLHWKPEHVEQTRGLAGRDTIVLIGSPAPHKNIELILRMADQLASHGLRVALVGNADPGVFRRAGATDAPNVHRLGRLPDPALAALLQDGLCLAFPSFVEGFGLPPLEAMAIGCPVIASDRTSLPEVCGDGALYAPPDEPERWFDNFMRIRKDAGLRDDLIRRGRKQVTHFSWRRSAETYLRAMALVDGWAEEHVRDVAPAPPTQTAGAKVGMPV
jgi:glycosyltransferase involved in cell wall biosynthesis